MIDITFSPKTQRAITKFINRGIPEFNAAIKTGLTKTGELAQIRIRRNAPRKTGNLRRSIDRIDLADRVIIGTNLKYAKIHEFGGTFTRNSIYGKKTKPFKVTYKKYKGVGYFNPIFQQVPTFGRIIMEREIQKFLDKNTK